MDDKKKKFAFPEASVIEFCANDIIVTSLEDRGVADGEWEEEGTHESL